MRISDWSSDVCSSDLATAVQASGRISPADSGLWNDAQVEAWAPITHFIREAGSLAAMQLAPAGRKASTAVPWDGGCALSVAQSGWRPIVAPSGAAFGAIGREQCGERVCQSE